MAAGTLRAGVPARPLIVLLFLGLSFLFYFPYLHAGFSGDDFIFLSMIEGDMPFDPLLGFWHGDLHSYPCFQSLWWIDRGVGGALLRPLPGWILMSLYEGFGRNALPYHAVLIMLHGLNALLAFFLLWRLSRRAAPAFLAAFLFLICEDHGMTVGWITTITDLVSTFFLLLALLCHVVHREEERRWLFIGSMIFFLAALLSKETAFVYPLLILAYEWVFAGPHAGGKGARFRLLLRRPWPWLTPILLVAAYSVLYRSVVPPMRNMMYVDPTGEPLRYIGTVITNLPVMITALLTQLLPSVAVLLPAALPYAAISGVALASLFLWGLAPFRRERVILFSSAAFVVGLLPGLAAVPGERLLYFPTIFGLFPVAWLIVRAPFLRRFLAPGSPRGVRVLGPVWGWYLFLSALVAPLALLYVYAPMWMDGMRVPDETVKQSLTAVEESGAEYVFYLNTSSSYNTFYLPDVFRYHLGRFIDVRPLSSFYGKVRAKAESEKALRLRADRRGWLGNMFASVVRMNPVLAEGETFEAPPLRATLLEVTGDGRDVLEARFEFDRPLEDGSFLFLYHDGRTYRRYQPSAEWKLLNPRLSGVGF